MCIVHNLKFNVLMLKCIIIISRNQSNDANNNYNNNNTWYSFSIIVYTKNKIKIKL